MAKLVCIFFSVFMTNYTFAELPYTFQKDTPARASEVNANFSSIDERVGKLETSNKAVGCEPPKGSYLLNNISYNYTSNTVNSGDNLVNVFGRDVYVANIPFVEHATRDKYYIQLPVAFPRGSVTGFGFNISTSSDTGQVVKFCGNRNISGFPFEVIAREERRDLGVWISSTSSTLGIEIRKPLEVNLYLKVNTTLVSIPLSYPMIQNDNEASSSLNTDSSKLDFNNQIDYQKMTPPLVDETYFDNLIDYIKIVKVP